MMLEPERAAALVAERLRRPQLHLQPRRGESLDGSATFLPAAAGAAGDDPLAGLTDAAGDAVIPLATKTKDWLVQRTLEELGIHCEATDALQDLKGFLIASPRGAEIVMSDRLTSDERLTLYAHLLAHALLEDLPAEGETPGSFFSRFEYVEGREPPPQSGAERRAEMVAHALAAAILRGRLDDAPEYCYRRRRQPITNTGLRPALGRLVLEISHRFSLALFWHLPQYQKLRSRPEMSLLIRQMQRLVRLTYAC